jgi:O-antigen biosynthesis protein
VEIAVLQTQLGQETLTAKLPWIVDCKPRSNSFASTSDILFIGGFGHAPNRQAIKFFAQEVMPLIRKRLPNVMLDVVGSDANEALSNMHTEFIRIHGHVPDLDGVLAGARVFVAPLLAGAGLKGKVLDAISRGMACVLSPIAAEGTGLIDGVDCIVARSPSEWADSVTRLYTDEELWGRVGASAMKFAESRYSFENAVVTFREALAKVGILGHKTGGLVYRRVRPERYTGD